jgi:hypothetical protein
MHEIACVSAIAAAYQLGATYEHSTILQKTFLPNICLSAMERGTGKQKRRTFEKFAMFVGLSCTLLKYIAETFNLMIRFVGQLVLQLLRLSHLPWQSVQSISPAVLPHIKGV